VNIAHHDQVGNFNFIALSSSIAGNVIIGNNCFIGNNATIKNGVSISNATLIGAGTYMNKDTEEEEVYVPSRSVRLHKSSSEIDLN
jgi:UDP-3-O-[3-hydroxymyristoyl] glucosamine N-acyltransferase